jgi:HSP90 family molecular chaperone
LSQREFDHRREHRRGALSPFFGTLKKKSIEVLYVVDPVDAYAVQQ